MARNKSKKVLFVSNLTNFIKFNIPYIDWFQDQGYVVDYAAAGEEELPQGYCRNHIRLPINRSPWSLKNIQSWRKLRSIINKEGYDIVHCHTPMGGVIARLAAKRARKQGTKVIYTAHGFHFYKGAPLLNWMLYYTAEKYLSKCTDCIITINEEDYKTIVKRKFRAQQIVKIDGVGVDLKRFFPVSNFQKDYYREQFGIKKDDFAILYIAEFIDRKNHIFLINAFQQIKKSIPNAKLVFAGTGVLLENCKEEVKRLEMRDEILFLGYRKDVPQLCQACDLLVSSSKQEGLPIGILEGMATGMPIICASIRGQVDVIDDGVNGYLYPVNNQKVFIEKVQKLYNNTELCKDMGKENIQRAQKYSVEKAVEAMSKVYQKYM